MPTTTTRLDATFYRLRVIQPLVVVFYMGSGLTLWTLLNAPLAGALLLGLALLAILNSLLPTPFASGFWLQNNGFVLQRGPFGQRKAFYGYDGFLRLFAMPARHQYIIVFDATSLNYQPQTTLTARFPLHQAQNGYSWLITPNALNSQFPLALIEHATSVAKTDEAPDMSVAYQAFLAYRRRGLWRFWPFR